MHQFSDLVERATIFTLNTLKDSSERVQEALQSSGGASVHIKNLQVIRLEKAIMAVGMFSMFDAMLQGGLSCEDGFAGARECLESAGEIELARRFAQFTTAINVLKHGRGRSYDILLAEAEPLPFHLLRPGESFEGDSTQIAALIEVDDAFVMACAGVIRKVSDVINRIRPGVWM